MTIEVKYIYTHTIAKSKINLISLAPQPSLRHIISRFFICCQITEITLGILKFDCLLRFFKSNEKKKSMDTVVCIELVKETRNKLDSLKRIYTNKTKKRAHRSMG